jgi:hypothetical protein
MASRSEPTAPEPRPTNAELDVLRELWQMGAATVREVHERLSVAKPLALHHDAENLAGDGGGGPRDARRLAAIARLYRRGARGSDAAEARRRSDSDRVVRSKALDYLTGR